MPGYGDSTTASKALLASVHSTDAMSCIYCTLQAEGKGSREYSREADLSDEFGGNLGGVLLINSYKNHSRSRTGHGLQQHSCCSQMLAKHQQM